MAVHTDLPDEIWYCIFLLLAAELDLLTLLRVSRFFFNLICEPLFLISHFEKHHTLKPNCDFLLTKNPKALCLFSNKKMETLATTPETKFEIFGTFKGVLGLITTKRKVRNIAAMYNPFINTYTSIPLPSDSPPSQPIIVAMFNLHILIGFDYPNNGFLYNVIEGKWKDITLPDYLSYKPRNSQFYPNAMVLETPYWSFKKDIKDQSYLSFRFDGEFKQLPNFTTHDDKTDFISLKDLYAGLFLDRVNNNLMIYVLRDDVWERTYTVGPVLGWEGQICQPFLLGTALVKHFVGSLYMCNVKRRRTWTIDGELAPIQSVFTYTPSILMFKESKKACWGNDRNPDKMFHEMGIQTRR